jgi:HAD superfamily hydrolase (TIGR01509 family)
VELKVKKALLFDLSDVLIEGFNSIIKPLAEKFDIPQNNVIPGLGGNHLVAFIEGKISESTYWRSVLERTHWGIPEDELRALVRKVFQKPIVGMPELLASLRTYHLILFSDQGKEWWEYIEATHKFLSIFEQRFLSFEMGKTKMQVDTFYHVLEELKFKPRDCLFIDDLQWNVERAESIGIRSHTFINIEGLREFLDANGINYIEDPSIKYPP